MLRDVERGVEPVGQAADGARGVGRGARRARARAGRPGAGGPLLGRLRRVVRRARADGGRFDGEAPAAPPGVDFAILGPRESCTGDPARRRATSTSSRRFAEQNVETLNEAGVTKIVASCPHCFNTLANEYPDFGGRYEVMHHSELLAELVRDGQLSPTAGERDDHLPRLLLPRAPQRRARGAARARGGDRDSRSRWREAASGRSAAAPAARTCGWRSAARRSTRSARARRPTPAPRRSPSPALLHGHARRRRAADGPRAARRRRLHAARRGPRARHTAAGPESSEAEHLLVAWRGDDPNRRATESGRR